MSNFIEFDTVMPIKKENVIIDEDIEEKKQERIIDDDVSPPPLHLPEDLVLENILTRLPAMDLGRFTCVSKLWYNSILNDTRFALSHFAQNRNRRNLSFNLFNVSNKDDDDDVVRSYFFQLQKDSLNEHHIDCCYEFELISGISSAGGIEPVGDCNGLACIKCASKPSFVKMSVLSSFRKEALTLTYINPEIGEGGGSLAYLCHGFGFDSLSQEYKIVVIYTIRRVEGDQEFICMVITLGDAVWRKIIISTSEISPPPGRCPFPSGMMFALTDDTWEHTHRSGTICEGDLLWRIAVTSPDDDYDYDDSETNEIEMLLSFNIHNEKIQFIQLPNECNSLITTMNDVDDCVELLHHILEFKGYPCVARSEKICGPLYYHFKVHLYILKDKVKQIWAEEETFDVLLREEDFVKPNNVLQNPLEQLFHKSKHSSNQLSLRTRMFSFSDQVMLYWFDGRCLMFYNLRMKHNNVVNRTHPCNKRIRDIFEAKLMGLPDPDGKDVPECPCIDYQLHARQENIISLKTFIPEFGEFVWYEEFRQFVADKQPKGYAYC